MVPFEGPRDAKLAIVSQQPGNEETRTGRNYVGKSSCVLEACFQILGIDRETVRLGNVLQCQVTRGELSGPMAREALAACRDRRETAGDLDGVEVILALGVVAAEELTGERIVLSGAQPRRGAIHHDRQGRIVIPTWQPQALWEAGGSAERKKHAGKALSDAEANVLIQDVERGHDLAHGKRKLFNPEIVTTDNPKTFIDFCRSIGNEPVGVDVETDGVDPRTAALQTIGLAVGDENSCRAISWRCDRGVPTECRDALRPILASRSIPTVYHNLQFDVAVLERDIGPVDGPICDTMLAMHALMPEVKLDLGSTAHTWLCVHPWKYEFRQFERDEKKAGRPPGSTQQWWDRLLVYNALDSATTIASWHRLSEECRKVDVLKIHDLDVEMAKVAYKMTETGLYLHPATRDRIKEDLEAEARRSEQTLLDEVVSNVVAAADNDLHTDSLEDLLAEIQKASNKGIPKRRWRKLKMPPKPRKKGPPVYPDQIKMFDLGPPAQDPPMGDAPDSQTSGALLSSAVGSSADPGLAGPLKDESGRYLGVNGKPINGRVLRVKEDRAFVEPPWPEKVWRNRAWNPGSPLQLRPALDVCGVNVSGGGLTSKGQRSLSKHVLVDVVHHPFVAALVERRKYRRFLSVYFYSPDLNIDDDNRLHVSWRVHATPTGRWASGTGKDRGKGDVGIAVQNWPQRMREMVEAPEGCVLVDADYAQLEFRVIGLFSGEKTLLEAFNNPTVKRDLHAENAARLYRKQWLMYDPDRALSDEERAAFAHQRYMIRLFTKTGVYASLYGAVPGTVQRQLRAKSLQVDDPKFAKMLREVSIKTCQMFVDAIPRFWPTLAHWHHETADKIQREGSWICPWSGRRRVWPLNRADRSQALNTPIQMGAASIMNSRFVILKDLLPPEARIILQVHDSVTIEVPERLGPEVRDLVTKTMSTTMTHAGNECVFPMEAEIVKRWYTPKN